MHAVLIGGLWTTRAVWSETERALHALGHTTRAVALPGQGDGDASATLADQIAAVLDAVDDAVATGERPWVVGHSAASTLAWIAADRRATDVAGVMLVGGMPSSDGDSYAAFFPRDSGVMPFPGWEPFAGADSDDLSDEQRDAFAANAQPTPAAVAEGIVSLSNTERYRVPVVMVCPEFSAEQARAWVADGDIPELAAATDVRYIDVASGHWPMISQPVALASALSEAAR